MSKPKPKQRPHSQNRDEGPKVHVPPHNIQAEQAALGACLIDPDAFETLQEALTGPQDFYREIHQDIFEALRRLAESNLRQDLLTVTSELRAMGRLAEGTPAYLDSMLSHVHHSAHLRSYVQIVADRAAERRLLIASQRIASNAVDPELSVAEKTELAEQLVFGVSDQRRADQLVQMDPTLDRVLDKIFERVDSEEEIPGLATGFADLDRMTCGLQPQDFIVLGARPSMGKTAFLLQLTLNVLRRRDKPGRVAVFSLEMSKDQLATRLLSMVSGVTYLDMLRGNLRSEDAQRLMRARAELSRAPLFVDETSGITALELKSKARRLHRQQGLDLILVDYLQLMRGTGAAQNRALEVGEVSAQLKALAKELHVPVLALSQVGRGVDIRAEKRPGMADLKESGAIEQDADLVAFLYRDEYYNPHTEDAGVAEFILAKHRNGPLGTVRLAFDKRFARFRTLSRMDETPSYRTSEPPPPASRVLGPDGLEFDEVPL